MKYKTSLDAVMKRAADAGQSLTLQDIASKSGVQYYTVRRWAIGFYNGAPLDVLGKLCDALECTPNDLLDGGNE